MNIQRLILALVMAGILAMPAFAKEGEARKSGSKYQEFLKELNLSEEQIKQIETNKQKQKELSKTLRDQIRSQREVMRQELMKAELDMGKIDVIQTQLKTLYAQQMDNRLSSILEIRKILTPEQFNQFLLKMKQLREERFEKRGKNAETK
jgi:Spy/CpxP family protein refolding chaperone